MASSMGISGNVKSSYAEGQNYGPSLALLTSLFFMWGFITCLNDILIPHLKNLFDLSYTQTMLIQFIFFGAYFLMSLPAGLIVNKIGYRRGIVVGLSVTGVGALMFYPASITVSYAIFLAGFFVLASGITLLQVAANPYVSVLGKPETASGRLNMTQAFNSLGTTIAPVIGAFLILGGSLFFPISTENTQKLVATPNAFEYQYNSKSIALPAIAQSPDNAIKSAIVDKEQNIWFETTTSVQRFDGKQWKTYASVNGTFDSETLGILLNEKDEIAYANAERVQQFKNEEAKLVQKPYIFLAILLFAIAAVFAFVKLPNITSEESSKSGGSAWGHTHLVLGALAIFLYVGTEVSIGSFLVNFLGLKDIGDLAPSDAGRFVSLYWGGAMIGRFFGAVSLTGMSKAYQRILNVVILVFAFLLFWWLTSDMKTAGMFFIFAVLNLGAFYIGQNRPQRTLAVLAGSAMLLVLTTVIAPGSIAMWTILAVGLFNSIMFPTIFTLAISGLGKNTGHGSGILCMSIVGGAILPLIMGVLADNFGIKHSFLLALIGYAYILFYGLKGYVNKQAIGASN